MAADPLRVLICAHREGLDDLMNRAAVEAIATPLRHVAQILSGEMLLTWLQYYDQWLQVLREVQKVKASDDGDWEEEARRLRGVCKVYINLADGPQSLRNLDITFDDPRYSETLEWKKKAGEMVATLKPFSRVLRGAARVSCT